MRLIGANPAPQVVGLEKLPGKVNYFTGNDRTKWRTNIATYAKVKYERVYEGVDLVYYGNQRQLEYDFIVAPGADPRAVRFGFEGAERIEVDARGNLVLQLSDGQVRFRTPDVYQIVDGVRQEIASAYVLHGTHEAGFQLAQYDASKPLIIDPVLVYSTYVGAANSDKGLAIAVDTSGNSYITGQTWSVSSTALGFPATGGAHQTTFGGFNTDAFVTKLNAAGSALIYSTYLGGGSGGAEGLREEGRGIAVDDSGNAYVAGRTNAADFPTTTGAFQTSLGGTSDCFVTKFNAAGSALIYSTYLGGPDASVFGLGGGFDHCNDIAVDASGNAHVTGVTNSVTIPGFSLAGFPVTANAFQRHFSGCFTPFCSILTHDAFVTKLNAAGSALIYSSYLGGTGNPRNSRESEEGRGVAVGASGIIHVAGATNSNDFPTTNSNDFPTTSDAFQPAKGDTADFFSDAFVAKFDPSVDPSACSGGTVIRPCPQSLVYSTYLGGNSSDSANDIATDADGNVYVAGTTFSTDFPGTAGSPIQPMISPGGVLGIGDGFVAKLNAAGSALDYSTYLGGEGFDVVYGIALDSDNNAYVTGRTEAIEGTLVSPFEQSDDCGGGSIDAFVTKVNAAGTALLFSTYLGGGSQDEGRGIAVDAAGDAYVTGFTSSNNFPTAGSPPFQAVRAGSFDAFVSKLPTTGCELAADTTAPVVTPPADLEVTAKSASGIAVTDPAIVAFLGGASAEDDLDGVLTPTNNAPPDFFPIGTTVVTFSATDAAGNTGTAVASVTVVDPPPVVSLSGANLAQEGDTETYNFTVTDPVDTTFTVTAGFPDCGAGGSLVGSVTTTASGGSFQCQFPDGPANPTVRIQVTDSGAIDSNIDTIAVTVANVAPTANAGGPYNVNEGGTVGLAGTGNDVPGDPLTFSWDLNNDGSFETAFQNPTFPAAGRDGPDSQVVRLQVDDGDGGITVAEVVVTIDNVAPTVGAITAPVVPVQVGTLVNASATFTDPGTPDTHTALFSWGDTTTSAGSVDQVNDSVTGSHTYFTAGVYTVTLTVTDDDLGSGQSIFQFIVVYDPSAGFVTGGGWIDSPLGAYRADPTLTGRANFGFVSKYKKGATTPTGQTEFQFKVADLKFRSTSYEFLVIAGAKALFKGTGTINGGGNFGFILSAIDAALTPSTTIDKFRIKIFDKNSGDAVVYDNQLGAADDADPTTFITRGSIVIHEGK